MKYIIIGKKGIYMNQPILFIAHGSPMNAISNNVFTKSLEQLGEKLKINKPKGILMISAHWLTNGATFIDVNENPRTIYDFGGFPDELRKVKYSSPGAPLLANQIIQNIKSPQILPTSEWGLDHGSWSILKYLFPKEDVPVTQLSIDFSLSMKEHFEIGKKLSFLANEGYLIIGSGNLIHNLQVVDFQNKSTIASHPWVTTLSKSIVDALNNNDIDELLNYYQFPYANIGIKSPDHYIPFLYTLGASQALNYKYSYIYSGFELGTLDMRSIQFS